MKVKQTYSVDLLDINDEKLVNSIIMEDERGLDVIEEAIADEMYANQIAPGLNNKEKFKTSLNDDEIQLVINSLSYKIRKKITEEDAVSLESKYFINVPKLTYKNLIRQYKDTEEEKKEERSPNKIGSDKKRQKALKKWKIKTANELLENYTKSQVDEILDNPTWNQLQEENAILNHSQKWGIEIELPGTEIPYSDDSELDKEFHRIGRDRGHKGIMRHEDLPIELHLDSAGTEKKAYRLELVTDTLASDQIPETLNKIRIFLDKAQNEPQNIKKSMVWNPDPKLTKNIRDYIRKNLRGKVRRGQDNTTSNAIAPQITTTYTAREIINGVLSEQLHLSAVDGASKLKLLMEDLSSKIYEAEQKGSKEKEINKLADELL